MKVKRDLKILRLGGNQVRDGIEQRPARSRPQFTDCRKGEKGEDGDLVIS